jgi:methionyl-tRNA formyltransferase
MRLVFMGTPAFAVPTLTWLIEAGHEIAAVYTQPPRPAGRGRRLRPSPVQQVAEVRGLPVRCPERLRDPADQAAFAALETDAAVVVAYGLILPKAILDAPRLGCINLHASLLPRWRGAAPIQRAIMAGDAETGICAMLMEPGLDTGPVLRCITTPIGATETAGNLADRLADLGAPLIGQALSGLDAGTLHAVPQPEEGVIYAHKIDKAEARIDWSRPATAIAAQIRGLNPAPGAFTHLAGERLKIWAATPVGGNGAPGTTLDDSLTVACGRGALRLERVQREGRPAVDRSALLAGLPVPAGTQLGDD